MEATPAVLDYGRPERPRWRQIARVIFRLAAVLLIVAALVWAMLTGWQSWTRYRFTVEFKTGYAALAHHQLPAGTVIVDPTVSRLIVMKSQAGAGGPLQVPTLVIPIDPFVEANLKKMHLNRSLTPVVFTGEVRSPAGTRFIRAIALEHRPSMAPSDIYVSVIEDQMKPEKFPFYKYRFTGSGFNLHFLPFNGHSLPVILAGQPDATGQSWTMPLIVDDRHEWVRFDYSASTGVPAVTASFGTIQPGRIPFELRY